MRNRIHVRAPRTTHGVRHSRRHRQRSLPIVAVPIGRNPIQLRVPGCLECIVATGPIFFPSGDDAAQRDRNKPPRWSNLRATGCVSRAHRAAPGRDDRAGPSRELREKRSDGRRRVSHSAPGARARATDILIAMPEDHLSVIIRLIITCTAHPIAFHTNGSRRLDVARRACSGLPGAGGAGTHPIDRGPIGPQRSGAVCSGRGPDARRAARTPGYRRATELQGQRSSGEIASGPRLRPRGRDRPP